MLSELEKGLGYVFHDKALLTNALTHSSYANENRDRGIHDNERLEFLGDAILGFVVADYLYRSFPTRPEGELTRIPADLVCETTNLAQTGGHRPAGVPAAWPRRAGRRQKTRQHRLGCDGVGHCRVVVWTAARGGKGIIDQLILRDVPTGQAHNFDYRLPFRSLCSGKKDQELHYVY